MEPSSAIKSEDIEIFKIVYVLLKKKYSESRQPMQNRVPYDTPKRENPRVR